MLISIKYATNDQVQILEMLDLLTTSHNNISLNPMQESNQKLKHHSNSAKIGYSPRNPEEIHQMSPMTELASSYSRMLLSTSRQHCQGEHPNRHTFKTPQKSSAMDIQAQPPYSYVTPVRKSANQNWLLHKQQVLMMSPKKPEPTIKPLTQLDFKHMFCMFNKVSAAINQGQIGRNQTQNDHPFILKGTPICRKLNHDTKPTNRLWMKPKNRCIECNQLATEDYVLLDCTHRIHPSCGQSLLWKISCPECPDI